MAGFVYVMSNPAFPHLVKIGKSSKDPTKERVNELNQTGVPAAFKVEYYAFVADEDYLERKIHASLTRHRLSANREFFEISASAAVSVIRGVAVSERLLKYEELYFELIEEESVTLPQYTQRLVQWSEARDRNANCPCNSGMRWKHCCGSKI